LEKIAKNNYHNIGPCLHIKIILLLHDNLLLKKSYTEFVDEHADQLLLAVKPGLPDGIFSNQKSQFG
jgi:hypothetical protein